jgi:cytochrome d ubiquinol oxidase subunit I
VQAAGEARSGPGDYLPPPWIGTFPGVMIGLAFIMLLVALLGSLLTFRNWVVRWRIPLYVLVLFIPLPFVAAIAGWLFREIGRQPWLVNGWLLRAGRI